MARARRRWMREQGMFDPATFVLYCALDEITKRYLQNRFFSGLLESFRNTLEDLGGGLGVTDPVSGPVVLALK